MLNNHMHNCTINKTHSHRHHHQITIASLVSPDTALTPLMNKTMIHLQTTLLSCPHPTLSIQIWSSPSKPSPTMSSPSMSNSTLSTPTPSSLILHPTRLLQSNPTTHCKINASVLTQKTVSFDTPSVLTGQN